MSTSARPGQRTRCACGCGRWTLRTWARNHEYDALMDMVQGLGFRSWAQMYRVHREGRIIVLPRTEA